MRKLIALALLLFCAAPAAAADSTVSALTAASALAGTELFYCVQSAADRKCTPAQIATYVESLTSGDCTYTGAVITCTKTNGVAFGTAATVNTGTSGATIPLLNAANTFSAVQTFNANDLKLGGVTGSTQCLHADTSGVVTGTGSDCGAGGGGAAQDWGHYKVNNWYVPWGSGAFTAGVTNQGNGNIHCFWGTIKETVTIGSLGGNVTTNSAGNAQFAIYNNKSGTSFQPGTEVDHTGSVSTASVAAVSAALSGGNKQLTAGGYWFCSNSDNSASVLAAIQVGNSMAQYNGSTSIINIASAAVVNSLSTASTFGTWGDQSAATFTEVSTSARMPLVAFQPVSVP